MKALRTFVVGVLALIGALTLFAVSFVAFMGWDLNDRFFRLSASYRLQYMLHTEDFSALAEQLEQGPPLGENDLCLKEACLEAQRRQPKNPSPSALDTQKEIYTPLINGFGFPASSFLSVADSGTVNTVPLSYEANGVIVNATLHYTGGEDTGVSDCTRAPKGDSQDICAIQLSKEWLVKYQWLPETALPDPVRDFPDSPEAKCDAKKNESFAAYSECLRTTPGKPAELPCDGEKLSDAAFNKCIEDVVPRRR